MFCEPLFYIQRIHSFLFCISNVLMTIPPVHHALHFIAYVYLMFSLLSTTIHPATAEDCLLSNNINDYHVVAQGKTTIPNVNDGEEFELTDVRHRHHLLPLA